MLTFTRKDNFTSLTAVLNFCPKQNSACFRTLARKPCKVVSINSHYKQAAVKAERKKYRLDELCLQLYPQHSKTLIQSWIMQGKVLVNDKYEDKPGHQVLSSASIQINAVESKYVCRAGFKLEAAFNEFGIRVEGKVALDSGLSTGGFTDCLLKHGASQVFGIDVGYGQVDDRIRRDERVVVMERFNLRYLKPTDLSQMVQVVTLDLSFISVLKVLPAITTVLQPGGDLIVLIKPQFEAGREQVGRGGLVSDPQVHAECIARVVDGAKALGFSHCGTIESPLKGEKSGNTEFLAHFLFQLNKTVS